MGPCIIICPVCGTYIKTHTPPVRTCPRCGNRLVDLGRQQILDEAAKCIGIDRNEQYGEPEDNFKTIAAMWTVYLNGQSVISAADVAAMMVLLKTARISGGEAKADNWIDIAGYAACGGEVQCNTSCR